MTPEMWRAYALKTADYCSPALDDPFAVKAARLWVEGYSGTLRVDVFHESNPAFRRDGCAWYLRFAVGAMSLGTGSIMMAWDLLECATNFREYELKALENLVLGIDSPERALIDLIENGNLAP